MGSKLRICNVVICRRDEPATQTATPSQVFDVRSRTEEAHVVIPTT